ncbi:MAG: hypothetical protein ACRYG7_13200 [Janthinobacterium lividum]
MAPRPKTRTPGSALLHTGPLADVLPTAVPEGKGGELIQVEYWGANNQLPQEVLRVLYDSGTASTCVERLGLFIGGKGFASEITATTMANPFQTFNQLLAEASEMAAVGLGVAFIHRYTYGGELAEVYVTDTDCLRREKDGNRFVVNVKLATGTMPVTHNEVYLPYDPLATPEQLSEEVIAAAGSETGYWGHIYFSFTKKMGRKRYPIPVWWAAKEAVEADAEAPKYDLKQFRNGFYPDAIMTVVGKKYDDVPTDENWKPGEGESEYDMPMSKSPDRIAIEKDLKALKGSSSEASILLNTVETEDEKPQIDWVDKGPNSKGLTDATNRIEGRVYRRMGVPPVLCGVSEPGVLGSNQQIVNSVQLFGLTVNPRRALITEPLKQWFPTMDFTVRPLDPVDYIDPAVAAAMTQDELRALRELPPLTPAPAPAPTPKPKAV